MRNDKIIGALIGLVGAAGNSGWTEKTDQTIVSALLQEDNDETIGEIHREKYWLSPGCSTCTAPCGNTSDYDMSCFWNGSLEERKRKHDIINELQQVAEQYNNGKLKRLPEVCFRALACFSYGMDEAAYESLMSDFHNIAETV